MLPQNSYRVFATNQNAKNLLSSAFYELLQRFPSSTELVFICIGTDRSTGDSLGPLVGTFLDRFSIPNIYVYGTLENPVHALNLKQTLIKVERKHPNATIIAVDACLGKPKSIGYIELGVGSIRPGAGVHKDLPAVGDLHITGIVNISGFMEFMVLQNTRLKVVMNMAEVIADSIRDVCSNQIPSLPYYTEPSSLLDQKR